MSKFKFDTILQKIELTKKELPVKLANVTQNYFVGTFVKQGIGKEKWAEVQRRIRDTPKWKYPKNKGLSRRTKSIGVMTGQMRRDANNMVVVATWNRMYLVLRTPYASYFNDGTKHSPARPIVKQTEELTTIQRDLIEGTFDKIWPK